MQVWTSSHLKVYNAGEVTNCTTMIKTHHIVAALALVCCSVVGAADEAAVSTSQNQQPVAKVYLGQPIFLWKVHFLWNR